MKYKKKKKKKYTKVTTINQSKIRENMRNVIHDFRWPWKFFEKKKKKKDFNILRGQHLRAVDDTRQLDTWKSTTRQCRGFLHTQKPVSAPIVTTISVILAHGIFPSGLFSPFNRSFCLPLCVGVAKVLSR